MKWFIMSDIHGSAYWCNRALENSEKENCSRILLLGDILYHGPRNDLPRDYAPKRVARMLNDIKNKILCVRGNCEAEVDQMVLDFPVMADYAAVVSDGGIIYATHGHKFGRQNPPPVMPGDAIISGHTHVPDIAQENGVLYLNPGSVSLPKQESPHSFMTFDGSRFIWKDMDGNIFAEREFR